MSTVFSRQLDNARGRAAKAVEAKNAAVARLVENPENNDARTAFLAAVNEERDANHELQMLGAASAEFARAERDQSRAQYLKSALTAGHEAFKLATARGQACKAIDKALADLCSAVQEFQALGSAAERSFDKMAAAIPPEGRSPGNVEARNALARHCMSASGEAVVIPLLQTFADAVRGLNTHGLVEWRVHPVPEKTVTAANDEALQQLGRRMAELMRGIEQEVEQ